MDFIEKMQKVKHKVETVMFEDAIKGLKIFIDGKENDAKFIPIDEAFAIAEYIIIQIFRTQKENATNEGINLAETLKILIEWREGIIELLQAKEKNQKGIE